MVERRELVSSLAVRWNVIMEDFGDPLKLPTLTLKQNFSLQHQHNIRQTSNGSKEKSQLVDY